MKTLFDETRIGMMELKNRLVRSATWEAVADETGRPTPRLITVYRELAEGGVGLIITSATSITEDATRLHGMLGIPNDSYILAYRELTGMVHERGSPIIMQLSFTGRNGEMWEPKDPSLQEIRSIVQSFGDAAFRAKLAGFNGVQIHSAHGFFLSRFLNCRNNTRTDGYGGDIQGRIRLLLEIYEEIRVRTGPDFSILVKINCSDFEGEDGVWDACRAACFHLAEAGVSGIEISGGVSGSPFPPPEIQYGESVFRDYAAEIAEKVTVPVILVGLNRTPLVLRSILNTTRIGYFSLSRPLIRQPDLPGIWQADQGQPAACISCDGCRKQSETVCPLRE
ncbi:MAG: NADH:flavin oxidoreductase [Methanospirillum sp.]|nr:NADH:flavin oxidoreductase [Methanospirillum sp.]